MIKQIKFFILLSASGRTPLCDGALLVDRFSSNFLLLKWKIAHSVSVVAQSAIYFKELQLNRYLLTTNYQFYATTPKSILNI